MYFLLAGIFGSHAFQLLPYWREDIMRKPDPAHTLANEITAILQGFTGDIALYTVLIV